MQWWSCLLFNLLFSHSQPTHQIIKSRFHYLILPVFFLVLMLDPEIAWSKRFNLVCNNGLVRSTCFPQTLAGWFSCFSILNLSFLCSLIEPIVQRGYEKPYPLISSYFLLSIRYCHYQRWRYHWQHAMTLRILPMIPSSPKDQWNTNVSYFYQPSCRTKHKTTSQSVYVAMNGIMVV